MIEPHLRAKSSWPAAAALLGAFLSATVACQAQLGNLLKKLDAGSAAPATGTSTAPAGALDEFAKALDATSSQVLLARIAFVEAETKMMEALGLKTDALIKQREALEATKGASSSERVAVMKDSTKSSEEAQKVSTERMAKSEVLSAESKARFLEGAIKFIEAIALERTQLEGLKKLSEHRKQLIAAPTAMEKIKAAVAAKPAADLMLMVPGDLKLAGSTLGKILEFATKQGIQIPNAEQATQLLG